MRRLLLPLLLVELVTATPASAQYLSNAPSRQEVADAIGAAALGTIDSPNITGTPLVPTAAVGTNTSQAASTAFVARDLGNRTRGTLNAAEPQAPYARGALCDGSTDDTDQLQATINVASNDGFPVVKLPHGTCKFSRLYLYRDGTLNPGFSSAQAGRLIIEGAGQMEDGDALYYPTLGATGTVLKSTSTTGNAVTIAPASFDADPYPSRQVSLRDLSIVAGTTGYVLYSAASPLATLERVTILQTNAAGHGVWWHSAWGASWSRVFVTSNAANGTGRGVDFGNTGPGAGNFAVRDSAFAHFGTGFYVANAGAFTNLAFTSTAFQGNTSFGFDAASPIKGLSFTDCHWEFNGTSHARVVGATSVHVRGGYALGGTTIAASMTGAMFVFSDTNSFHVDGLMVFRPWTSIISHVFDGGGSAGTCEVRNVVVEQYDNTPAGTIYLLAVNVREALCTLSKNRLATSALVKEYDATTYPPVQAKAIPDLYGAVYLVPSDGPVVRVKVTGAGGFIQLPAGTPGRQLIVASEQDSSTDTTLMQPDGVTPLVLALSPGKAALCIYDAALGNWIAVRGDFAGI